MSFTTDQAAMDRIARMLQAPEWDSAADYIEEIAAIVAETGRTTETIYRHAGGLIHSDCIPADVFDTAPAYPPDGYEAVGDPLYDLSPGDVCVACEKPVLSRRAS